MVEFQTQPYVPMDRKYHEPMEVEPVRAESNLEEPIIPMYELGTTVPEQDPAGRFKNMVQGVQAAIRRGAGRIQLVFQTPHTSAIGGRPKAYGPEVREQLREVFKANEAILTGVEMPTSSLNNLSGFDPQRGQISDEVRDNNLDEVRDAIQFVADVAEGGGVDLVSFEFSRPVFNADWNRVDPETGKQIFEQTGERVIQTVDTRTGRISGYRVDEVEKRPIALDKETGKRFSWEPSRNEWVLWQDPVRKVGEIRAIKNIGPWNWEDYEAEARRKSEEQGKPITAEEIFMTELHETNKMQAEGMVAYHEGIIEDIEAGLVRLKLEIENRGELRGRDPETGKLSFAPIDDAAVEDKKNKRERLRRRYHAESRNIESYKIQAAETQKLIESTKPLRTFAKQKSMDGYAEAGVMARQETHNNPRARAPVYVGPEIGWPDYYGGHPEEFMELIKGARRKMVAMLTQEKIQDPRDPTKWVDNPYFEPGMSAEAAKEEAANHIRGCFDTSHMGMWLKHFRPDLPWHKRVEKFNKWYMDQVKKLAKEDVVGSIQLVNSMSAAHGHLPADQGIFPVVDAAKEFKRQGFKGFMVSEGHEEEKFEEGRIMTQTWRAFNAPFESKYGPGPGFQDINQGYAGRTYSPRMMFGSYVPPFGEYKPWSEIPFE